MANPFGAAPKYMDFASGGVAVSDEVLVAGQSGMAVRVLALLVQTDSNAETVVFESGTGSQLLELNLAANQGAVLPSGTVPWFETAAGESLTVSTTTTSDVSILVVYVMGRPGT